jgi:hypothetical protein
MKIDFDNLPEEARLCIPLEERMREILNTPPPESEDVVEAEQRGIIERLKKGGCGYEGWKISVSRRLKPKEIDRIFDNIVNGSFVFEEKMKDIKKASAKRMKKEFLHYSKHMDKCVRLIRKIEEHNSDITHFDFLVGNCLTGQYSVYQILFNTEQKGTRKYLESYF